MYIGSCRDECEFGVGVRVLASGVKGTQPFMQGALRRVSACSQTNTWAEDNCMLRCFRLSTTLARKFESPSDVVKCR